MNTDSGNRHKVFTLRQNRCSHKTRTGVHFEPEWVFTLGQNMQPATPTVFAKLWVFFTMGVLFLGSKATSATAAKRTFSFSKNLALLELFFAQHRHPETQTKPAAAAAE